MYQNRTLVRNDNLDEMRSFSNECIDLIATDPPFNSKRDYFVPFRDEYGAEPDTLIKAFADTWTWGNVAEETYEELLVKIGGQVGDTIKGLREFLKETPMMAYLVMMAVRIVEMHRILKNTGSLYLHCDPTASHYLKIVLDSVFEPQNFRNEIVWKRRLDTHNRATSHMGKNHDTIFYYAKSAETVYNIQYTPYNPAYIESHYKYEDTTGTYRLLPCTNETGGNKPYTFEGVTRSWRFSETNMNEMHESDLLVQLQEGGPFYYKKYLKDAKGVPIQDIWVDIAPVRGNDRTGYPTQKPRALYEQIIRASSNKGDIVLDPFCGCGTTLLAAEAAERQWIGIDLTYLAIGAVKMQAQHFFKAGTDSITVIGTPENENQALELAETDPQGFEEWCVTHVLKFKSNAKKVGDDGVDGSFRFPKYVGSKISGKRQYGKAVAQVKGGKYVLGDIRDFRTAMQDEKADLGVFVVTRPPSKGMLRVSSKMGTYSDDFLDIKVPALQIYEIQDFFRGILPKLPYGIRTTL